jgi:secretion/DNA translocation related TadE-like protein
VSGRQQRCGRRPGAGAGDDGSATIWAVGGIAVLFLVAAAVLAMGSVVQTRHRATAAADLAALAAATYAPDGAPAACDRARWVADRMRVRLTSCVLAGWDALVEVSAAPPGELSRFGLVTEHSRAGPVDP